MTVAPRTVHHARTSPQKLADGRWSYTLQPGGRIDPLGCVLEDFPGGRTWADHFMVGDASDPFQMMVPDIRMPPNQYWPLHWHDCWIAVIILDGTCLLGDWWMQPGDMLITAPGLEYGPLLAGASGVRMFEIFARAHQQAGGYAPEYRDHPTLQGTSSVFKERSALNLRNAGRQVLPVDGVDGLIKGHLWPGGRWDLGEAGEGERGIIESLQLKPGQEMPLARHLDWTAIVILDGSIILSGRELAAEEVVVVEPDQEAWTVEAGGQGAAILMLARTAAGLKAAGP